jgi:hypothetical protein
MVYAYHKEKTPGTAHPLAMGCILKDNKPDICKLSPIGLLRGMKTGILSSCHIKPDELNELRKCWGAAIANRIVKGESRKERHFVDFEPLGNDHFYVIWYQPMDCEYSEDVKAIQSLMVDDIHFAISDKPEKNKWALVWLITDTSKPDGRARPHWLYIHEIFEDGVIDEGYEYPKCAIQRKDLEVPPPPFDLTGDVVAAFKAALREESIAKYLIQDRKDVFSLAYSQKGVLPLVAKMKEYMANKANSADAKNRRG